MAWWLWWLLLSPPVAMTWAGRYAAYDPEPLIDFRDLRELGLLLLFSPILFPVAVVHLAFLLVLFLPAALLDRATRSSHPSE